MFSQKFKKTQAAFTLIEAVLYTVILSMVVGVISALVIMIYRNQTIIEDRVMINEDFRLLVKSIRDDMYVGSSFSILPDGSLQITASANGQPDITYSIQNAQVLRQENGDEPVPITSDATNVEQFAVADISSPNAAGTIRLQVSMSNYPRGSVKPLVTQSLTSTISLKYI